MHVYTACMDMCKHAGVYVYGVSVFHVHTSLLVTHLYLLVHVISVLGYGWISTTPYI